MEDSGQVEIKGGAFQLQRIMSIYVKMRQSETHLQNSKYSILARTIKDS